MRGSFYGPALLGSVNGRLHLRGYSFRGGLSQDGSWWNPRPGLRPITCLAGNRNPRVYGTQSRGLPAGESLLARIVTVSRYERRRRIQLCPVKAKLPRCQYELIIVQRLDDIAVCEVVVCAHPIPLLSGGTKNNDGQMHGALIRANRFENFLTADLGNVEIEQDKQRQVVSVSRRIIAARKEVVECLQPIACPHQWILDL